MIAKVDVEFFKALDLVGQVDGERQVNGEPAAAHDAHTKTQWSGVHHQLVFRIQLAP